MASVYTLRLLDGPSAEMPNDGAIRTGPSLVPPRPDRRAGKREEHRQRPKCPSALAPTLSLKSLTRLTSYGRRTLSTYLHGRELFPFRSKFRAGEECWLLSIFGAYLRLGMEGRLPIWACHSLRLNLLDELDVEVGIC